MTELESIFGLIDIYLFDQLLKGRILPGSRVLDAGCGLGRNLIYLPREGYEVFCTDVDPDAIAAGTRKSSLRTSLRRTSASSPSER